MDREAVFERLVETIRHNPLYYQPFQLVIKAEKMGLASNVADQTVADAWCQEKPNYKKESVLEAIATCRELKII